MAKNVFIVPVNDSANTVRPSEIFTLPLIVSLPENFSSSVLIDIQTNVTDTASFTLRGAEIMYIGQNLPKTLTLKNEVFQMKNSTFNNTQYDKLIIDLGIVSNSGFTSRMQNPQEKDNQMFIKVEFQCADSVINIQNSTIYISFALKYGKIIKLFNHPIKIFRSNFEKPELNMQTFCTKRNFSDKK